MRVPIDLSPERQILLAGIAAAFFGALMLTNGMTVEYDVLDQRCEEWDELAAGALATMIRERNLAADHRLGDAVFRLRRARRNCRAGWHELARRDYEALTYGRFARAVSRRS